MALKKLTRLALNKIFNPCLATRLPFSSLSPFIAPEIIPMEEKLAKDTKKTERMAVVRAENVQSPFAHSVIATNSFVTSLVAMRLPASTASFQGIPVINAKGANT